MIAVLGDLLNYQETERAGFFKQSGILREEARYLYYQWR
jgi:hypothetical protein